jgi:hypothetical protein
MHWNKRPCLPPALAARKELPANLHLCDEILCHSHRGRYARACSAGPQSDLSGAHEQAWYPVRLLISISEPRSRSGPCE